MDKKWYQNNLVIIAFIIFFFPVGLFLMWKYSNWNKWAKWVITGFFVLVILGGILSPSDSSTKTESTTTKEVSTPSPTNSPTNTPIPFEKVKVNVTSQIVKKVDGKYRYFFDIRNNDTKDFNGEVTISLLNNKQKSSLGGETFNTTRPIKPSLGTSVNFDINSGPISEHGEYGITKYTYTVRVNGAEVNSGEGTISEEFENLDF